MVTACGGLRPGDVLVRLLSGFVVIAALALPVGLAVKWWRPSEVAARETTPAAVLAAEDRARYTAFADSEAVDRPVIISYHDVTENREQSPYAVTPSQFEEQMSMLAAAGFTSVTAQQMADYIEGRPLPPRSVWITFDDGAKGIWRYADRILERHGFTATAFIITGSVGTHQPYYLTWGELRAMEKSGRWDFGAHTDDGHRYVYSGPGETERGPYLLVRQWLDDQRRQETLEEWRTRVADDFDASIDAFEHEGFDQPLFFAHPFAAVSAPTNDPGIPGLLDEIIEQRFVGGVANDSDAAAVGPDQIFLRLFDRIGVRGTTTTNQLFERIRNASDLPT